MGLALLEGLLVSCVLLFLLYSIRVYRESHTAAALSFTAAVYFYLTVFLVWRWVEVVWR
jgi:hypothetical protein